MKLYCLGLDPSSSCFLLKIHHVCVLLDCGLELASLLTFLPDGLKDSLNSEEFKKSLPSLNFKQIGANTYINSAPKFHLPQLSLIDISSVDAIVITNFYNILALPYITEYTGFKGKIYATEPTIQMGSLLMHELVNFHQSYINQQDTSIWQTKDSFKVLDPVHREKLLYSSHWRPLYTSHNIDIAISKVSPVNFLQEINIFDLVTVIPVSSGYCLGGANLVIKTHYDKIVYMAHTSGISRHPEPFDATLMKLPHTLILTQLQSPTVQPKSLENSFVEFSGAIQHTLAMGGSVIVPVYSCGVILDLFEYVDNFLGSASLRHATQYYVSPVSETVLAYADIVPEWLCKQKQDRVYLPEAPFLHADMIRGATMVQMQNIHVNFAMVLASQKTKPYKFINSMKEPRIIYVGHPSCRFGDVVHLIQTLGANPKNTIIMIEPDYDPVLTLAPFYPLVCKVVHIPLDPRLTVQEAQLLVTDLQPQHLVIPKSYEAIGDSMPPGGVLSFLSHLDVVNIPITQWFERASLTKELSLKLQPHVVCGSTEMAAASMIAQLTAWDNHLVLSPASDDSTKPVLQALWGSPTIDGIVSHLADQGITAVEVVQDKTDFSILITDPGVSPKQARNAVVKLSQSSTQIITDDESLRTIITRAILSQCTFFNKTAQY